MADRVNTTEEWQEFKGGIMRWNRGGIFPTKIHTECIFNMCKYLQNYKHGLVYLIWKCVKSYEGFPARELPALIFIT